MTETLSFYAPDLSLVLLWGVIAFVSVALVLWMCGLFGRAGVFGAVALIAAGGIGLWLSAGPFQILYFVAWVLPAIFGALVGAAVCSVGISR